MSSRKLLAWQQSHELLLFKATLTVLWIVSERETQPYNTYTYSQKDQLKGPVFWMKIVIVVGMEKTLSEVK